ncbi:hypothetical protein LCGC14_2895120, partial [marine sediment metagenome]
MRRFLMMLITACLAWPVLAADTKPNIVFILADDLGWQDVGFARAEFAGAEFFETPHIDALAEQGTTFSAGHSGGPNCAPTRACLMSGTYVPRHMIYTPGGLSKGNIKYMRLLVPARNRRDKALQKQAASQFPITNSLDPKFICIPEVLKPAGYTSARIGKWHLGEDTQGFDLSSANGKGGPDGSFYGNVDVAEQEKIGQTGVAERKRDERVAVAGAGAEAQIGEATANRDMRQETAGLDAQAVESETEADAKKAAYRANQNVAEEEARNRAESAGKEADGAIRVAQEIAQKEAEDARALREQARLNAEIVVPANAERERVVIAAEAQKTQAIRIAEGQAEANVAKM